MHRGGEYRSVWPTARVEGGIQFAVGIQSGDVVSVGAVGGIEIARDDNLAGVGTIGNDGHRSNLPGNARPRIKCRIHNAVSLETRYAFSGKTIDGGKSTANHNFPIRLNGDVVHETISARSDRKGRIERAVIVQTRDAIDRHPVNGGKIAANENLPGCLICIRDVKHFLNHVNRAVGAGIWIAVIEGRILRKLDVRSAPRLVIVLDGEGGEVYCGRHPGNNSKQEILIELRVVVVDQDDGTPVLPARRDGSDSAKRIAGRLSKTERRGVIPKIVDAGQREIGSSLYQSQTGVKGH